MKKFKIRITIMISIFLILITIFPANSFTLDPSLYNAKYTVKVGDSKQFKWYKNLALNGKKNSDSLLLTNGTSINYNTSNAVLTVTIAGLNKSSSGLDQVYTNTTIDLSGIGIFESPEIDTTINWYIPFETQAAVIFVSPSFDNTTDLNSFLKNYTNFFNMSYSIKNDSYTLHTENTYTEGAKNTTIIQSFDISFNWQTGWLDYWEASNRYSNNTYLEDYYFGSLTNPPMSASSSSTIKASLPGFNVNIIIITLAVLTVLSRSIKRKKKIL